jgi:hypothetical protein
MTNSEKARMWLTDNATNFLGVSARQDARHASRVLSARSGSRKRWTHGGASSMSESSRRIHQASRRAILAKATLKGMGYTDEDITWTETRVIALMLTGLPFVEAVDLASTECVKRLFGRRVAAFVVEEDRRQHRRDENIVKQEAEQAERRAKLEARATLGQRPSLKTSLGDLIAARRAR